MSLVSSGDNEWFFLTIGIQKAQHAWLIVFLRLVNLSYLRASFCLWVRQDLEAIARILQVEVSLNLSSRCNIWGNREDPNHKRVHFYLFQQDLMLLKSTNMTFLMFIIMSHYCSVYSSMYICVCERKKKYPDVHFSILYCF